MSKELEQARDGQLVLRGLQGDREALGELVDLYHGVIFKLAYRMLGNSEDAADVTQATFLSAFENLRSYRPEHRFFSWLYRIGVNQAMDCRDRGRRVETLSDNDSAMIAPSGEPEAAMRHWQLQGQVQDALLLLNDEHRAVIVLRHFSECSYSEIGEILSIPERTVKSRLFEARKLMRGNLAKGNGHVE